MTKQNGTTKTSKTTKTTTTAVPAETVTKTAVAVHTMLPADGLAGIQPGSTYELDLFTEAQIGELKNTWKMRQGTVVDEGTHQDRRLLQFVSLRNPAAPVVEAEPVTQEPAAAPVVIQNPSPAILELQAARKTVEAARKTVETPAAPSAPPFEYNAKFPHLVTLTFSATGDQKYERFATPKQAAKRAAQINKGGKISAVCSVMVDPNATPAQAPAKGTKAVKTAKAKATSETLRVGKFNPLFGFPATRAICWMGTQGFDFTAAKAALAHFDVVGVSDSTVRVQLGHGVKQNGNPATFTTEQAAQVLKFKGGAAAESTPAPKGGKGKSKATKVA